MKAKFTILLMLAAFVLLFAGEAPAAPKPAWLKTTWSGKLVKNPHAKNAQTGSADYLAIEINVKHTNTSKDQDVTAFYDKTMTFSATVPNNVRYTNQDGKAVKYTVKSSVVNKREVWPAQSYSLIYWMPVKNLISPGRVLYHDQTSRSTESRDATWGEVNAELIKHGINAFQNRKLNYNVNIRSKKAE